MYRKRSSFFLSIPKLDQSQFQHSIPVEGVTKACLAQEGTLFIVRAEIVYKNYLFNHDK